MLWCIDGRRQFDLAYGETTSFNVAEHVGRERTDDTVRLDAWCCGREKPCLQGRMVGI